MTFRLDRFATLYVFNPLIRHRSDNGQSIPILMYHSIADEDEAKVHAYYRTATSSRVFAKHMQHLRDLGYRTVNMADAVTCLHKGGLNGKCAVITFDDGYADFYTNAFPELNRHGFTATVFLPTAYIGTRALQFKAKDCLTWAQVRELRRYGMCFGSHTVSHPQLSSLNSTAVKNEIVDSKHTIEDSLGEPVDSFAYPFAFPEGNRPFVRMLRDALVESGYREGVSTRIGTARQQDDPYFMRRLPMNSLDDAALFAAKLEGGYDWLYAIQYGSKLLRRN